MACLGATKKRIEAVTTSLREPVTCHVAPKIMGEQSEKYNIVILIEEYMYLYSYRATKSTDVISEIATDGDRERFEVHLTIIIKRTWRCTWRL